MKNFLKIENLQKILHSNQNFDLNKIVVETKEGLIYFENEPRQKLIFHIISNEALMKFSLKAHSRYIHEFEWFRLWYDEETNETFIDMLK